ncbi:MAG: hypothetical protein OQK03_12700, partial [Colwellia sp.]|nr:hypothetical protein [Colwellia sp.]
MKKLSLVYLTFLLSACSSLPNLDVGYYLPKSQVVITVNQIVACKDVANWSYTVLNTIDIEEQYSADTSSIKYISLKNIDSWYSKSDIEIGLKDDGRLSSINSSNSGHVGEYVDKVVSLVSNIKSQEIKPDSHICDFVVKHHETKFDKAIGIYTLNLVFKARNDFTNKVDNKIHFKPMNITSANYNSYSDFLGSISGSFTNTNTHSTEHFKNIKDITNTEFIVFKVPLLVKVQVDVINKSPTTASKTVKAPHLS